MFILKGCPRCGGDLSRGLDDEVTCLQCGHALPAGSAPAARRDRIRLDGESHEARRRPAWID